MWCWNKPFSLAWLSNESSSAFCKRLASWSYGLNTTGPLLSFLRQISKPQCDTEALIYQHYCASVVKNLLWQKFVLKFGFPISAQDSMIYWYYCASRGKNLLWQKFALKVSFPISVPVSNGSLMFLQGSSDFRVTLLPLKWTRNLTVYIYYQ